MAVVFIEELPYSYSTPSTTVNNVAISCPEVLNMPPPCHPIPGPEWTRNLRCGLNTNSCWIEKYSRVSWSLFYFVMCWCPETWGAGHVTQWESVRILRLKFSCTLYLLNNFMSGNWASYHNSDGKAKIAEVWYWLLLQQPEFCLLAFLWLLSG